MIGIDMKLVVKYYQYEEEEGENKKLKRKKKKIANRWAGAEVVFAIAFGQE